MSELIVFPSVDGALIDWAPDALAERGLTGWRVADRLAGDRSVAIYAAGGTGALVVDSQTVIVEVRDALLSRASRAMQMLRALIHDLEGRDVGGVSVLGVREFAGPANLPTLDAPIRLTMTLSIDVSADVL